MRECRSRNAESEHRGSIAQRAEIVYGRARSCRGFTEKCRCASERVHAIARGDKNTSGHRTGMRASHVEEEPQQCGRPRQDQCSAVGDGLDAEGGGGGGDGTPLHDERERSARGVFALAPGKAGCSASSG